MSAKRKNTLTPDLKTSPDTRYLGNKKLTQEMITIPYHRPVDGLTVTAHNGKVLVRPVNTPYKPDEYTKYDKKAGGYVMNYKTFADFMYAPYGKLTKATCTPSPLYKSYLFTEEASTQSAMDFATAPLPKTEPSKETPMSPIDPRWNTEPWHWEAPKTERLSIFDLTDEQLKNAASVNVFESPWTTPEPSPIDAITQKYAWIERWENDPQKRMYKSTIANGKANRRAELAALGAINVTAEFQKLSVNA